MTEEERPGGRHRVRRGEGEVTQWPRGLLDYVPAGPEEAEPAAEEDRTRNRLLLAGRLLTFLRARGLDVEREVAALRSAERAFSAGDSSKAAALVDGLLARLDDLSGAGLPTR